MSILRTRLTERFEIQHPILSAPMAWAAGGKLAAAVSGAGGLGLIGGGYGDGPWLEEQFAAAGDAIVGYGFITWSLAKNPQLLIQVLNRQPQAIMLSFGDPRPHATLITAAGVPLICQCQTLEHVRQALAVGATAIVAQGSEAGGHGQSRGTLNFVVEVSDLLKSQSPQTLLLAAGGIADGRGLAAALMLGADGVLMGTRFWATREALVHSSHHQALLASNGDATVQTRTPDIARQRAWPPEFPVRVMNNTFVRKWQGREAELVRALEEEGPKYRAAFERGDTEQGAVFFGEAAGLIGEILTAKDVVERTVGQAVDSIGSTQKCIVL
jgi:nitronate monooxygenase